MGYIYFFIFANNSLNIIVYSSNKPNDSCKIKLISKNNWIKQLFIITLIDKSKILKGAFMDGLTKTGTYIFAIPIGILGIIHFLMGSSIAAGLPSFYFAPLFWVYLSGLSLLAAAISILIRKYTRLACLLLALLFFILVLTVDLPGLINNAASYMEISILLKDLSIAGGALVIAAVSSRPEAL
jgi:putative oxidoreductase